RRRRDRRGRGARPRRCRASPASSTVVRAARRVAGQHGRRMRRRDAPRAGGGIVIELVALDMAGTTIDEHGDVYVALHDAVAAEAVDASNDLVAKWMGTDKREAIANLVVEGGGAPLDDAGIERGYDRFRTLLRERYDARPPTPIAGVPGALAAL